jgi:class II lanthipeptide synthase
MTVVAVPGETRLLLDTASQIGRRLCHEAIWHGGRCNWVGASNEEGASGQLSATYAALGPDLYGGTSGVALFLAQLYAVTGDAAAQRAATGAIGQALSRIDDLPRETWAGVYGGRMGIALAAARVGVLLEKPELLERLERATALLHALHPAGEEFDLISGLAGGIIGLLVLRELLDDEQLVERAIQFGDRLLESGQRREDWCSWKSPNMSSRRNLTGFSHGTAGVGYALLELFRLTGQDAYRLGAEQTFNYERHLFDRQAQNWPDFRERRLRRGRSQAPFSSAVSFATFWCHGAAGIGLSRLRAYELLSDATCEAEATAAVTTTSKVITTAQASGLGNYSLCHGLAGNVEVLMHATRILGSRFGNAQDPALEVAKAGTDSYAAPGRAWPCGTHEGETPSLFLGLAGIGLFYLRLCDPRIPSVLLLRPEDFSQQRK